VTLCRASIQSPKLELRYSDVREVRGTFDLVVCMNVLEHIEDALGTLRHLIRMIRPGGTFFLLVPAHQFLYNAFDIESGHFRRYNRRGMLRLIRQASDGDALQLRQFYFNAVGALGYFGVYKLLGRHPAGSRHRDRPVRHLRRSHSAASGAAHPAIRHLAGIRACQEYRKRRGKTGLGAEQRGRVKLKH
jgi:SAM-dependent methyltransferase